MPICTTAEVVINDFGGAPLQRLWRPTGDFVWEQGGSGSASLERLDCDAIEINAWWHHLALWVPGATNGPLWLGPFDTSDPQRLRAVGMMQWLRWRSIDSTELTGTADLAADWAVRYLAAAQRQGRLPLTLVPWDGYADATAVSAGSVGTDLLEEFTRLNNAGLMWGTQGAWLYAGIHHSCVPGGVIPVSAFVDPDTIIIGSEAPTQVLYRYSDTNSVRYPPFPTVSGRVYTHPNGVAATKTQAAAEAKRTYDRLQSAYATGTVVLRSDAPVSLSDLVPGRWFTIARGANFGQGMVQSVTLSLDKGAVSSVTVQFVGVEQP